jgi:hypothetical protein
MWSSVSPFSLPLGFRKGQKNVASEIYAAVVLETILLKVSQFKRLWRASFNEYYEDTAIHYKCDKEGTEGARSRATRRNTLQVSRLNQAIAISDATIMAEQIPKSRSRLHLECPLRRTGFSSIASRLDAPTMLLVLSFSFAKTSSLWLRTCKMRVSPEQIRELHCCTIDRAVICTRNGRRQTTISQPRGKRGMLDGSKVPVDNPNSSNRTRYNCV